MQGGRDTLHRDVSRSPFLCASRALTSRSERRCYRFEADSKGGVGEWQRKAGIAYGSSLLGSFKPVQKVTQGSDTDGGDGGSQV